MPTLYRKIDKKPIPSGAEVFTRHGHPHARWRDRRGRTQSAPVSEDGERIVIERPNWYFDYDGPEGRKTGCKGYRDKEATLALAQRRERDSARARQGLTPSVDPGRAQSCWEDVLGEWLADLERQSCDDVYIGNMRRLVTKVAAGCSWTTLAGIRGDRVIAWLADIKKNGVLDTSGKRKSTLPSDRTVDQYLEVARRFLDWCRCQRPPYLAENPLSAIKKIPKPKRVRRRRALSESELGRLLEAAGPRAPIYKIAALTGLRKDEIRQLQWRDCRLDEAKPGIQLRPEANKSRRDDRIPLSASVAELLKALRPQEPHPLDPVFPVIPTLDTLKRDLTRAGISYRDPEGRQADFHSLRYSFCTMLAKAGVPIRTAMELMRHKDPKLTLQLYCDAGQLETDEAVGRLPSLPVNAAR